MESDPTLKWEVGEELKSYYRRIAVEYQIKKSIENNQLDLIYQIEKNVRKNCSHIEIFNKNSILTIHQVQNKYDLPRDAKYRSNLAYVNQLRLFSEFEEEDTNNQTPYILLTYGGNELPDFIILGMPDFSVKNWIARISLLEEPFLAQLNLPEEPEQESIVKLKEYLKDKYERGKI